MKQMEPELEQHLSGRIRERAYEIWIASGYRDAEPIRFPAQRSANVALWQSLLQSGSQAAPSDHFLLAKRLSQTWSATCRSLLTARVKDSDLEPEKTPLRRLLRKKLSS
jgi:hypothetical protein